MLVSLVPRVRLSRAGARESLGMRLMSCGPRSELHTYIIYLTPVTTVILTCYIQSQYIVLSERSECMCQCKCPDVQCVLSVLEADPVEPGWDAGVHGGRRSPPPAPTLERAVVNSVNASHAVHAHARRSTGRTSGRFES